MCNSTIKHTSAPRAIPSAWLTLLALSFSLLWSSAFIAGKVAVVSCPPLLLLSVRFLLAGPLMLLAARIQGHSWIPDRTMLCWALVLGVLNNTLYLGLSFTGLKTVPAGLVVVIVSAAPFITMTLARFMLGERLSRMGMISLVVGFGGVAVIMLPRLQGVNADISGMALTMLGTCAFSLGTVLFKRAPVQLNLFALVGHQTVLGGLLLLPAALLLEDVHTVRYTPELLQSLLYLVLVVSVGATMLWFLLVRRSSASIASTYHFLNPVFGLLLGWGLLGESINGVEVLGTAFVILGIVGITRSNTRKADAA